MFSEIEAAVLRHRNAKHRSLIISRELMGLCTKCGKADARPQGRWCEDCYEAQKETKSEDPRGAERRRLRRKAGLCPKCGKPCAFARKACEKCLTKDRDRQRRKKEVKNG